MLRVLRFSANADSVRVSNNLSGFLASSGFIVLMIARLDTGVKFMLDLWTGLYYGTSRAEAG